MSTPSVINGIIKTLEADKNRQWSQDDLAEHVLKNCNTGFKNTSHIIYGLRALVASGRISGQFNGDDTRVMRLKWKPAQDEAAMNALRVASESIKNLNAELESLRSTKPEDTVRLHEKVQALELTLKHAAQAKAAAEQELADTKEKLDKAADCVFEVRTQEADGTTRSTKGMFHKQFKRVLKLAAARKRIFLYGPTGCGKSHICEQVAQALNLPFKFVSCSAGMSEAQLSGRLLPLGDGGKFEYVISEFVTAYEHGGVFLLDEIDAADPNVLLLVNAALSNGQMALPNRPAAPYAKMHKDFICIAAANTVGTGASRMYSGRNKLDGATLDRFNIGKIHMDYDANVEAELCPNDDLRNTLLRWRTAINDHGLERAMSSRFLKDAYEMMYGQPDDMCFDMDDIKDAYFQGWREDEKNKVLNF